ncbi:CRIB domain-containing protein RIC10-like [Zingiber officinale]|uniref:CRIB domain-containing protein RIC10-like n=1 Tax=Zingiber officinale TaxID=94328 RepID=UPI001C4A83AF|nr:CRIB domain-containing protein RIC10-like [Zingiber officinale]
MKGIFKGMRYISQIFVVQQKEHEMEIGYPTDVKHVAHIGSDSPFWMEEFKSASDFSGSLSNYGSVGDSWASQDFDRQRDIFMDPPLPRIPKAPKKKKKRSKKKTTESSSSSSEQSSVKPTESLV